MKNKTSKKAETANSVKPDVSSSAIVREKSYSIKWIEYADGKCSMERKCDGFVAYELLGIITLTQQEIIGQIKGRIKPDFTKREVVK